MAMRRLKRNICKECGQLHYVRSPLAKFCSSRCQSRTWRKNKETIQQQGSLAPENKTNSSKTQEEVTQ